MMTPANEADIRNGKRVQLNCDEAQVVMISNDEVLAVYEREKENIYRCVRGLW